MRAQNLRILLIDDNRHGLVARRTVLQQQGHQVSTAGSGAAGLELFAAEPFDLVVTDYRMPEMSGAQVIRKIRQQEPNIPIVLLSGFVEALGLTEQSTGADVVLSKGPGEVQELIRTVARLARRRSPAKPPGSTAVSRRQPARTPKKKTG